MPEEDYFENVVVQALKLSKSYFFYQSTACINSEFCYYTPAYTRQKNTVSLYLSRCKIDEFVSHTHTHILLSSHFF